MTHAYSTTALVFTTLICAGCASSPRAAQDAAPAEALSLQNLDEVRAQLVGTWRYGMEVDVATASSEQFSGTYLAGLERGKVRETNLVGQIEFREDGTARELQSAQVHTAIFELGPQLEPVRTLYSLDRGTTFGITIDKVIDYTWTLSREGDETIITLAVIDQDALARDMLIDKQNAEKVLRAAPLMEGQTQEERDAQTDDLLLGFLRGQQELSVAGPGDEASKRLGIESMTDTFAMLDHDAFLMKYERGQAEMPTRFEKDTLFTSADIAGEWTYERVNDSQGRQIFKEAPSDASGLDPDTAMARGEIVLRADGTGFEREHIWTVGLQVTPVVVGIGAEPCPIELPARIASEMVITTPFEWGIRREAGKRFVDTALSEYTMQVRTILIDGKTPRELFLEADPGGTLTREQLEQCATTFTQHVASKTERYPESIPLRREVLGHSKDTLRLADTMRRLDMSRARPE